MHKKRFRRISRGSVVFALSILAIAAGGSVFAGTEPEMQQAAKPEEENSRDLFSYDGVYTFRSDFKNEPRLGEGDSLYNDFSYDHRFLITGKWYFRTGFEYERYDFGGTDNGLPDHLQALYGHLAIEYVVKDHAGAGLELDPGIYFQNRITSDAFDIPWKIFVSFPLKKVANPRPWICSTSTFCCVKRLPSPPERRDLGYGQSASRCGPPTRRLVPCPSYPGLCEYAARFQ